MQPWYNSARAHDMYGTFDRPCPQSNHPCASLFIGKVPIASKDKIMGMEKQQAVFSPLVTI